MTRRSAWWMVVAAAGAWLFAAAPGDLDAQPAPSATLIRVYAAFGPGALRPGVLVTRRVSGECFAASIADQARDDAWRCMSGNAIMDPCFQGFEGSVPVLACPETPWSPRVTLLRPTKVPARGQANESNIGRGMPWALEIGDGARCTFLTGATAGVAGMRVNYGCVDGKRSVIGDIDRTLPRWRVFVDPGTGVTVPLQDVAIAWY